MNKKQRNTLRELMRYCNGLGSSLDGTATNQQKYIDRQKAHMSVSLVLYAVLTDHPENDHSEEDWENANGALAKIKELVNKQYPDRQGYYTIIE